MASKKRGNRKPGPCPDPERYEWVDGTPNGYWRKKRTDGAVNSALAKGNQVMKKVSPFNRKIREQLKDFTADLVMGRVANRMYRRMYQSMEEHGKMLPEYFKDMEFQEEHWLRKLMLGSWLAEHDRAQRTFKISILINKRYTVKKESSLLTGYQFTAILVYGNKENDKEPRVVSTGSDVYKFTDGDMECVLELRLSTKPKWWILILRAECYEGAISAIHNRHRGMAVVDAGGVV